MASTVNNELYNASLSIAKSENIYKVQYRLVFITFVICLFIITLYVLPKYCHALGTNENAE